MNIRNLISGFLLATVSLIVSLVCAEGYVRLFHREQVNSEILHARFEAASIKTLIRPAKNPYIFYELQPNLELDFHGIWVKTGMEGYRIPTHLVSEQEGAIRIAVLGDSTSFGWRVTYDDSYPEKYRQLLEATFNVPIELRNYSVPGYNSTQELHLFLDKVVAYQPDLLILHYDHNDSEPTGLYQAPDYILPEYGDNPLHSALIKFVFRQTRAIQNHIQVNYDKDAHEYFDGYMVSGPLYEIHLASLQTLATETQSLHIPTIAVIFNAFIQANENFEESPQYILLHKNLSDQLAKMGFYTLDLYPLYQAKMQEEGWTDLRPWWIARTEPSDAHPNVENHQFIADALLEFTLQQPNLRQIFETTLAK